MSKSKKDNSGVVQGITRFLGELQIFGTTPESKTNKNPVFQELSNFLRELQNVRARKFEHLKQPGLIPLAIRGVPVANKTVVSDSGLEVVEARRLWASMNKIIKKMEDDCNEIGRNAENETERLKQQAAVLEKGLPPLRRKFGIICALNEELERFSKDKRGRYAAKRETALKLLGNAPQSSSLKIKWEPAKAVIEKEFSSDGPEPTGQDYANLLNAITRLKAIKTYLGQERTNFLRELQDIRTMKFEHLKQPGLIPLAIQGVTAASETVVSDSGVEVAEAQQLWASMNKIIKKMEDNCNEIGRNVENETERLKQQAAVLEDGLPPLRKMLAKVCALNEELKAFSQDKRGGYAAKREEALKLIKKAPRSSSLKLQWQAAKDVIEKEFSSEGSEPTDQDYANLLNAITRLKAVTTQQNSAKTIIIEPAPSLSEQESAKNELDALIIENSSLVTKISTNLQILRQLETTQWEELNLPPYRQNNAFQELAELYRAALGNESEKQGRLNGLLSNLSVTVNDTIQQMTGVDVKEAGQLKRKIDDITLRCENEVKALGQEWDILRTSRTSQANHLLKRQDAILEKLVKEVLPLYEQIGAVDKALIAFKASTDKEQLYAAKKSEFDVAFEPLLQKVTDLESQLKAELKGKQGPAIDALNHLLLEKMKQAKDAKEEIDSISNPGLKDYGHLLNKIFELKALEREIELYVETIAAKIPQQKHENEVREDHAQKVAMLYQTYHGLKSPHVQFKAEKVQEEALKILNESGENFEFDRRWIDAPIDRVAQEYQKYLAEVPLEEVKQRLKNIDGVIRALSSCLGKAKITQQAAQFNFQYFVNRYGSTTDSNVVDAVRRLAQGEDFVKGQFTGDFDQVKQLKDILIKQDMVIVDETFSITDSDDPFQETITFWSRAELVAYCKTAAEFAGIVFDGGIHSYLADLDLGDLARYEQAMAFNYQEQSKGAESNLFSGQMFNYFNMLSGNTEEELDEALKAIYQQIPRLVRDFQAQFPKIDTDVVSTFMREVQFSEGLGNIDDKEMQRLLSKQKSGELQDFLAEQIQVYADLQQKTVFSRTPNLSELAQLREKRDFIAKAYKLHWLSAVHKELANEEKFNEGSALAGRLRDVNSKLERLPLELFLDHELMANFASQFTEMQNQRSYSNLCHFYHAQEAILGHKDPMDPVEKDWSSKETGLKIEEINENIAANRAECLSAPLRLGLPEDFAALYNRNRASLEVPFLEGMMEGMRDFLFNPSVSFAEDEELMVELSNPLWLEDLASGFRTTLATEPSSDEICMGLLDNLNQLFGKIGKLSRFYEKLQILDTQRKEILEGILENYPSHEKQSGFFNRGQDKHWQQIQRAFENMPDEERNEHLDALQKRTISSVLRSYGEKRDTLKAAKDEGLNPAVNYKDLLSALVKDKQLLDAALAFHQKLEVKRSEQVGDLLEKLRKTEEILARVHRQVGLLEANNINETQSDLLRGVKNTLSIQKSRVQAQLKELELTSPYGDTLASKAVEANTFLTELPGILSSQVANEALYNQLDDAGKSAFEKLIEWLVEEICKAIGVEYKVEPKLSSAYRDKLGNLVSEIENSESEEEPNVPPTPPF